MAKTNKKSGMNMVTVGLVIIGLLLMLALRLKMNKSQDSRSSAYEEVLTEEQILKNVMTDDSSIDADFKSLEADLGN